MYINQHTINMTHSLKIDENNCYVGSSLTECWRQTQTLELGGLFQTIHVIMDSFPFVENHFWEFGT